MNSDDLRATLIERLDVVKPWPVSSKQIWDDYVLTDKEYRAYVSPGTSDTDLAKESRKAGTSDDIHVLFWTNEYEYHIALMLREVETGWLVATATPRKSRPGQQSEPKKVGEGSFGFWQLLMNQILGYEIVAKPKLPSDKVVQLPGMRAAVDHVNKPTCKNPWTSHQELDRDAPEIKAVFSSSDKLIAQLVGVSYTVGYNPEGLQDSIAGTLVAQDVDWVKAKHILMDQKYANGIWTFEGRYIPFDIVFTGVDGKEGRLVDVQIQNEIGGMTVDDMTCETTCTFTCRQLREDLSANCRLSLSE